VFVVCLSFCLSACLYVCVRVCVCVRAFMCVSCNTPGTCPCTHAACANSPTISAVVGHTIRFPSRWQGHLVPTDRVTLACPAVCPVTQPQPIDSPVTLVCCLLVRMRFTMYVSIHSGIQGLMSCCWVCLPIQFSVQLFGSAVQVDEVFTINILFDRSCHFHDRVH